MRPAAITLLVLTFVIAAARPARGAEEQVPGNGPVHFVNDVMPLVNKLGCNLSACHGAQFGQGGFKLSMFGADSKDDQEALTKQAEGRRINRVEPLKSLFLLKATASLPHEGGKKFEVGSAEYNLLAAWVVQGAKWGEKSAPKLVSVEVSPDQKALEKGATQQLAVAAVFSDESRKDVTDYAAFTSTERKVAAVDAGGIVKAEDVGQAYVIASYMRQSDNVRIVVPQPLPSGFPEVAANNKIDELVIAKLKELGIPPSDLCSDHEFLRRLYLDVTGTLPTTEEARAFLGDADPQKRSKLVDRLLASNEFANFWALKWGDLFRMKSEYPSNLWPNAVQTYHQWIRNSIARNKPFDRFATELITASGSNFRVPPSNYYRAFLKKEPQSLAEVTALIFMGARVGCARCHAHPLEDWDLDDNVGMAAFFAPVRYKATREWKEEIVYVNPLVTMRHPRTAEVVAPKFLGGEAVELEAEEDPRPKFAAWLTAPENPWFARSIVNRTWFWLLGRGIVHEPDDMRSTNPPENPELLRYLETELIGHKYDLKHVYRLILNSRTYQLSAKSNEWNRNDFAHFSRYYVKRLGAETLLDGIGQVTDRWDTYRSTIPEPFIVMPTGFRATHLADGSIDLPFLQLFGRPPRDTAYESDRDLELSMRQTLHLLNSSDVQNKINASPRLRQLITEVPEDPKVIEELYLATLSRTPTEAELGRLLAYLSGEGKPLPEAVVAEKRTADETSAKAKAEVTAATTAYDTAEKAAQAALAAAAPVKAATATAAAVQTNAEKAAPAKRQQADAAKKKLNDLITNQQKAAQAKLAAATKTVTDAATARNSANQPLAVANAATAKSQEAAQAAEKAAEEAEAIAKAISEDAAKSEEEKKQAAETAAVKRKAAEEAKAALAQAQQNEQQAQTQVDGAAKKLAAAEAQKKSAAEALAKVAGQVAAATTASQAADKAAQETETAVAGAKAAADKARADQTAADGAAAEKRRLADAAKATRDKAVAADKAATARLANASRKLDAAKAALKPRRDQALQDLLWALLNAKEFVFNH